MWVEPVTNRTIYNKGYLNDDVLNRIEGNCSYIAGQLFSYGYQISLVTKTDWTKTDFPDLNQINRIRDNVNELIDVYHKMPGSPDIRYWDSLDWQDTNSLEKNLLNLNTILENMKSSFKYCGTFYVGEEIVF
jgi:hypothetical protein